MKLKRKRKLYLVINAFLIAVLTFLCIVPILHVLALSFSSSDMIERNKVGLLPVEFNLQAYKYVIFDSRFWTAVVVSLKRVLLGVPINLLMIILASYPLSKSSTVFPARKYYAAFFIILMVFNGGLIPTYYVVTRLKLIDTIWALILPNAVPIFSVILMMNFFRGTPQELEEAARLDGATEWEILTRVYLPLAKPSVATVTLFSIINHWNSWFDGLIYSNFTENYPLQSYMQTQVINIQKYVMEGNIESLLRVMMINNENMKAAQIFISIIPLMMIYPYCAKHFTKGLTLGSVKG